MWVLNSGELQIYCGLWYIYWSQSIFYYLRESWKWHLWSAARGKSSLKVGSNYPELLALWQLQIPAFIYIHVLGNNCLPKWTVGHSGNLNTIGNAHDTHWYLGLLFEKDPFQNQAGLPSRSLPSCSTACLELHRQPCKGAGLCGRWVRTDGLGKYSVRIFSEYSFCAKRSTCKTYDSENKYLKLFEYVWISQNICEYIVYSGFLSLESSSKSLPWWFCIVHMVHPYTGQ